QPKTARLHGLCKSVQRIQQAHSYSLAARGGADVQMPEDDTPVPGRILCRREARQLAVFFRQHCIVPVLAFRRVIGPESIAFVERRRYGFFCQPEGPSLADRPVDAFRYERRVQRGERFDVLRPSGRADSQHSLAFLETQSSLSVSTNGLRVRVQKKYK